MTAAIATAHACGNDTAPFPDSALTVRLPEWPPRARCWTRGTRGGIPIAEVQLNMRQPTNDEGFSATEEEFFREGEAMNSNAAVEHVAEREVAEPAQRSGWSRWFARTPRAATAES